MIYAFAIAYVLLFWFVGWRWPKIALLLIFASAPFQYDISTGGPVRFSIAELNLLLTVPLLLARRPVLFGPTKWPMVAYFGISLVSTLAHWRASSLVSLIQMALYLLVAVTVFTSFVKNARDYRYALIGSVIVGVVLSVAVVVTRSGYVFNLHKNGVGSSLASAVIIGAELWFAETSAAKRNLLAAMLAVVVCGLFFTLSRGAWMGACAGLFALLTLRRQFKLLIRLAAVLLPLIAICWQLLPEQSQEYATGFSRENYNIKLRLDSIEFARLHFEESPLLGVGVGLRKEYDATNLVWLTLAETGVPGLLALLTVHGSFVAMVWKTQKHLAHSDMVFSLVALGGALVVSKFIHGMVDHYWSRGPIMVAWAAAGMATHGYFVTRQRIASARATRNVQRWIRPTTEVVA